MAAKRATPNGGSEIDASNITLTAQPKQTHNQPTKLLTTNRATNQPTNQNDQPIRLIDRPTNQPINQLTNQPINQPTNQPTSLAMRRFQAEAATRTHTPDGGKPRANKLGAPTIFAWLKEAFNFAQEYDHFSALDFS